MSAREGRGRRRNNKSEMVTIFWRDIPAQVTATVEGAKGSWVLEERFQVAIDRAAGVAGLTDAHDYVLHWRRVAVPCTGDPQVAAQTEAERLQDLYDRDRVRALVETGGLELDDDLNDDDPNDDDPQPATAGEPTKQAGEQ